MRVYGINNKVRKKTNQNKNNIIGIPRVTKYKYLGIIIDEKLKLTE